MTIGRVYWELLKTHQIDVCRAVVKRIISPERGVRIIAGGKPAEQAQPPEYGKIKWSPGRGDRRLCYTLILRFSVSGLTPYAVTGCRPLRGSENFFVLPGAWGFASRIRSLATPSRVER